MKRALIFAPLLLTWLIPANAEQPKRIERALAEYAAAPGIATSGVWIVQLREPAAMQGKRSTPSSLQITQKTFDRASIPTRKSGAIAGRAAALKTSHKSMISQLGDGAELIHSYRFAFNGFAARMTAAQAAALSEHPDVVNVFADAEKPVATDSSPQFLGLYDADTGLVSAEGLTGDNVVIAVIDSGITPESESFADTRDADSPRACRSSWGQNSLLGKWLCRSYRRRPDVSLFEPPEGWAGTCQTGDRFEETDCNNKLIGARFYIDGALARGSIDDGEIRSARDADGHGTHIAATAAGNRVSATLNGSEVATIRGVAPRARIAAYKACWLRPGSTRATCAISDLVQAIDDAVADGADIINYSIGNTESTVANADDVALLAATKAGVLAVVAAGNDGPSLGSIGSPAGSPWALSVGAASRAGQRFIEASEVTAPSNLAGRYPTIEATFTEALSESGAVTGTLVAADDGDDSNGGSIRDACQSLINGSDVSGAIVLIARGGCDFSDKLAQAEAAGAIAAVIYNNLGGPVVMGGNETATIPAVSLGQADGELFLDEINAGTTITIQLASGLFLTETDTGDVMGVFSSRGPSGGAPDILKPDVSAPGIGILSALTPDVANGTSGQLFGYLTGTSMAAPHVAGAAALLKERHPSWSPASMRSALMTSARQDLKQQDGVTDANPFDTGAGMIVPNDALDPGLIYDTSNDEFDAFTCGVLDYPIARTRCDALSMSGLSTDPSELNQPAITSEKLPFEQSFTRRVTATRTGSWQARLLLPAGFTGDVQPATLSLSEGQSQDVTILIGAPGQPANLWYFGALEWVSEDETVYSPIAVRPVAIDAPEEVRSAGGTGEVSFDVRFGFTGNYSTRNYGLKAATVTADFVDNDPSRQFTRRTDNGVTAFTLDVPTGQLFLRLALFDDATDGDDDLDLYAFYCPTPVTCQRVGESGEPTSNERIDIPGPLAGRYEIFVHGFATDQDAGGPGSNFELSTWLIGPLDENQNLSVNAPSFVSAGGQQELTASWQNLMVGQRYLGVIFHFGPEGLAALTTVTVDN
ncbi:MAG: S8 family serine peptidase [Pseudomonadota bacterium]